MPESIREKLAKKAAREAIAHAEYEIHKAHSSKLDSFLTGFGLAGPIAEIMGVPSPPKRSATVLTLLIDYADALFKHAVTHATETPDREVLMKRVEDAVISRVERKSIMGRSLSYHASEVEIRAAIREGLRELIEKPSPRTIENAPQKEIPKMSAAANAPSESLVERRAATRSAFVTPILKKKGMTPSRLATKAGVDPSVVYDYLSGKSNPRPDNRNLLAEVLGIDESKLPD